jgi:hypothetical protein
VIAEAGDAHVQLSASLGTPSCQHRKMFHCRQEDLKAQAVQSWDRLRRRDSIKLVVPLSFFGFECTPVAELVEAAVAERLGCEREPESSGSSLATACDGSRKLSSSGGTSKSCDIIERVLDWMNCIGGDMPVNRCMTRRNQMSSFRTSS